MKRTNLIIGAAVLTALAALGSACSSTRTATSPIPSATEAVLPSTAEALTPVNDVSAQGSVRAAIEASGQVFARDGSYQNLTAAKMKGTASTAQYVTTPSTSYDQVSFQIRGDSALALVAMSPSGVCFGAVSVADVFSYTHSGIDQTNCDAADVPYPYASWPGDEVAQK